MPSLADVAQHPATIIPPSPCEWTSYPVHGQRCPRTVPGEAVRRTWREALRAGAEPGFFRFAWKRETWLAYGHEDGRVGGVHCPRHHAARLLTGGSSPDTEVGAPHVAQQPAGAMTRACTLAEIPHEARPMTQNPARRSEPCH
jgi:hypothetical protein